MPAPGVDRTDAGPVAFQGTWGHLLAVVEDLLRSPVSDISPPLSGHTGQGVTLVWKDPLVQAEIDVNC